MCVCVCVCVCVLLVTRPWVDGVLYMVSEQCSKSRTLGSLFFYLFLFYLPCSAWKLMHGLSMLQTREEWMVGEEEDG